MITNNRKWEDQKTDNQKSNWSKKKKKKKKSKTNTKFENTNKHKNKNSDMKITE